MLSQLQKLSLAVDGRYASDAELQFIHEYAESFHLRAQTYQVLQAQEAQILQQVQATLRSLEPNLFYGGSEDISAKWKRDTVRVLRFSAIAMLINDPEALKERFLFWFQTIMKAFGAEKSCKMTYDVMQKVAMQQLTPAQARLFCPILEMNQRTLGKV